jgi:hypothetical protein
VSDRTLTALSAVAGTVRYSNVQTVGGVSNLQLATSNNTKMIVDNLNISGGNTSVNLSTAGGSYSLGNLSGGNTLTVTGSSGLSLTGAVTGTTGITVNTAAAPLIVRSTVNLAGAGPITVGVGSGLTRIQQGLLTGSVSGASWNSNTALPTAYYGVDPRGDSWSLASPASYYTGGPWPQYYGNGLFPQVWQYVYDGQIYVTTGGAVSFATDIDDQASIIVDGTVVVNSQANGVGTKTLTAGWHNIEIRLQNNATGAGYKTNSGTPPWNVTGSSPYGFFGMGVDWQGRNAYAQSNFTPLVVSNGVQMRTLASVSQFALVQFEGASAGGTWSSYATNGLTLQNGAAIGGIVNEVATGTPQLVNQIIDTLNVQTNAMVALQADRGTAAGLGGIVYFPNVQLGDGSLLYLQPNNGASILADVTLAGGTASILNPNPVGATNGVAYVGNIGGAGVVTVGGSGIGTSMYPIRMVGLLGAPVVQVDESGAPVILDSLYVNGVYESFNLGGNMLSVVGGTMVVNVDPGAGVLNIATSTAGLDIFSGQAGGSYGVNAGTTILLPNGGTVTGRVNQVATGVTPIVNNILPQMMDVGANQTLNLKADRGSVTGAVDGQVFFQNIVLESGATILASQSNGANLNMMVALNGSTGTINTFQNSNDRVYLQSVSNTAGGSLTLTGTGRLQVLGSVVVGGLTVNNGRVDFQNGSAVDTTPGNFVVTGQLSTVNFTSASALTTNRLDISGGTTTINFMPTLSQATTVTGGTLNLYSSVDSNAGVAYRGWTATTGGVLRLGDNLDGQFVNLGTNSVVTATGAGSRIYIQGRSAGTANATTISGTVSALAGGRVDIGTGSDATKSKVAINLTAAMTADGAGSIIGYNAPAAVTLTTANLPLVTLTNGGGFYSISTSDLTLSRDFKHAGGNGDWILGTFGSNLIITSGTCPASMFSTRGRALRSARRMRTAVSKWRRAAVPSWWITLPWARSTSIRSTCTPCRVGAS